MIFFSSIIDCLEDMHMEFHTVVLCLKCAFKWNQCDASVGFKLQEAQTNKKGCYEKWKSSVIASNKQNKTIGFESISFSVFRLTHCISSRQPY